MSMNAQNTVAKILKIYSIINFVACIILTFIIADAIGAVGLIVGLALSIGVNFVIYACGELLQLLHDIKLNTAKTVAAAPAAPAPVIPDELPEL